MQYRISIHALLAESDEGGCRYELFTIQYFYPRSPCGERHYKVMPLLEDLQISIHALLAESDAIVMLLYCSFQDFYPRSPCGERPAREQTAHEAQKFLSTLSLRRGTLDGRFKL